MSIVLIVEFDLPKDEARYRKYVEFQSWRGGLAKKYEKYIDTRGRMIQEGSLNVSAWADNTGHIIGWWEFDSIESFVKMWSVDDWHKWMLEETPLVDNRRIRLLRPALMITEDLIA